MLDNNEIRDVLGIEPVAQATQDITKASIEGISTFLGSIFKPGLEELGYLMKDQVRTWRLNNIVRTLEKAKGKMYFDGKELQLTANARVGLSIMEGCSVVDTEELQDMWAGLFVSSCTPDGRDDSNMNFVDLLRRMSSVEAKIIDYACTHYKKTLFPNKLLLPQSLTVSYDTLVKITGINDVYRLDSELDHMRAIELLDTAGDFTPGGGFNADDNNLDANITPSALALTLYYKTHPNGKSPIDYWGSDVVQFEEKGVV